MRRRGTTLIELMVVVAIIAILSIAIGEAFVVGLNYETNAEAARERVIARDRMEEKLTDLFRHAYLGTNQADTTTNFVATSSGNSTGNATGADTVTFTVQGIRVEGVLLASTDDFETLNDHYGPQGGIQEIGLSTTAVGDPGNQTGLFIRHQNPADSDITQGGTERLLDPNVSSISFEFWDGNAWQPSWTTQVGNTKRLPAAVQITYTLNNDADGQNHIIIVQLPLSDVTADNPADPSITGGTPSGGTP